MEKETNVTQSTETTVLNSAEEATASMREVAEPIGALAEAGVSATDNGTNAADNIDNSASAPADAENMPVSPQESKSLKKAEFEKLIKGEYKEFYEERIRDNLSRRFKENAQAKQRNAQNNRIVELLYDKYNVETGNSAALMNAIESDDAYLVAQANKRGMSIEDYKYIRRLETENKKYHALSEQYEAINNANRTVEKWYAESERLKEIYPEFNIFEESKNKSFVSLVKSGIDVKTAYEVIHHSEIVSRAAENAAKEAEIRTAEAIRQRAMRPAENGLSSQSSAIIKNDVSKLSANERAEIARRVSRGERITF